MYFDFLIWPMSSLILLRGKTLGPILQPTTRGQLRCLGHTHVVHIYIQSVDIAVGSQESWCNVYSPSVVIEWQNLENLAN